MIRRGTLGAQEGSSTHFQQLGCRGCGTGLCMSPAQSLCCGASAFLTVICHGLTGLTRDACPQLRVREHVARGDVACLQTHSSKRGSDTNLGPIPREGLCLRQFFFFFTFWPRPGIEPTPRAMQVQSLNPGTAREVPISPYCGHDCPHPPPLRVPADGARLDTCPRAQKSAVPVGPLPKLWDTG